LWAKRYKIPAQQQALTLYVTFMKPFLIIGIIGVTLFSSCKKKKTYLNFTDKQLVFVNYSKGQNLKFIDTTSVLQTLIQYKYKREFHEQVGLYGKTGAFTEEYEVLYRAENNGSLDLQISVDALNRSLSLEIVSYWNHIAINPDSLQPTIPSLTINGKTYNDIYLLKMYKNAQYINSSDTATLFHNKQYGVIQLLFPDGKKIVRSD
jgi:hypothetical protein